MRQIHRSVRLHERLLHANRRRFVAERLVEPPRSGVAAGDAESEQGRARPAGLDLRELASQQRSLKVREVAEQVIGATRTKGVGNVT